MAPQDIDIDDDSLLDEGGYAYGTPERCRAQTLRRRRQKSLAINVVNKTLECRLLMSLDRAGITDADFAHLGD